MYHLHSLPAVTQIRGHNSRRSPLPHGWFLPTLYLAVPYSWYQYVLREDFISTAVALASLVDPLVSSCASYLQQLS